MYESFLNKSIIDGFRVLVILCILIFASYSDYVDRTISTKVWYVAFSFGLLITIYELLTENIWNISSSILISVSVMFIIGYILQYTRIFYGADYRAFVIIGFMIPTYPDIFSLPLYDFSTYGSIKQVQFLGRYSITSNFQQFSLFLDELLVYVSSSVFGISVFINSSIIASGFFFFNIYKNIENGDFTIRRPLRSLSARKIQKEDLTNTYSIIIEETDNSNFIFRGIEYITSGLKGLSTSFYIEYMEWYRNKEKLNKNKTIKDIDKIQIEKFIEDNDDWRLESNDDIGEIKDFTEKYLESDELWVTISIPFIIPITIGTIASIVFGNLAYVILILI